MGIECGLNPQHFYYTPPGGVNHRKTFEKKHFLNISAFRPQQAHMWVQSGTRETAKYRKVAPRWPSYAKSDPKVTLVCRKWPHTDTDGWMMGTGGLSHSDTRTLTNAFTWFIKKLVESGTFQFDSQSNLHATCLLHRIQPPVVKGPIQLLAGWMALTRPGWTANQCCNCIKNDGFRV